MHCGLKESRVRNFQQPRHCNGARLVLYHRPHVTAELDTNSILVMPKDCPRFNSKYKAKCLEYKDKLRVVSSFHRQSVAAILQGDSKPKTAETSTAVATWKRANGYLCSILFSPSKRSANNNVVKTPMVKTREGGIGYEQAAWIALEQKYNHDTKEAGRAYHERMHRSEIKSGDDPDNLL